MKIENLHPTYLFVGQQEQLVEHAEKFVAAQLCKTSGCKGSCTSCKQVQQRQHYALLWISPEKDYTVDDIAGVFAKTMYALDPDEKFFFVLDKTHTLNQATANRLLKVLEEPPTGFHFILLTHNEQAMLTTIISRSFVQHLQAPASMQMHPLIDFFTNDMKNCDPIGFDQALRTHKLTDSESITLAESIYLFYAQSITKHHTKEKVLDDKTAARNMARADYLQEQMKKPPQSGSSKIFWKNLYMGFPG